MATRVVPSPVSCVAQPPKIFEKMKILSGWASQFRVCFTQIFTIFTKPDQEEGGGHHFLTPPKFSKFCQIADFGFGFDKKRPAPRGSAAFFETQSQNNEDQLENYEAQPQNTTKNVQRRSFGLATRRTFLTLFHVFA